MARSWIKMPHARTRNSRAGSCDPSTELSLRVWAKQDDPAIRLDRPEAKDLGHERADLARWEVRHRHDRPPDEIAPGVPRLNRGSGPADPVGAEINPQLVRRIAGLREILGSNDPTDAHLDFLEVLEPDDGHSFRARNGLGRFDPFRPAREDRCASARRDDS